MGLEIAALVVAGIATAGKVATQNAAAESAEASLDVKANQQTLEYQQKTLSNYDVMEKVLDAQTAAMTTRGTAFSSPSFNAIQRSTLNIGSKNQKNLDIENTIAEANIEAEKENVRNSLHAQLFGDVEDFAIGALTAASKFPTLEK